MLREDREFLSFETLLRKDIQLLCISGLYSMKNVFTRDVTKNTHWEIVPFVIGVMNLSLLVCCEIQTIFHTFSEDPKYAIVIFTSALSGTLDAVKGWRIYAWREELHGLLHGLATLWNESNVPFSVRAEIQQAAEATNIICRYYSIMVIFLVTSYATKPYILLLHFHIFAVTNESFDYTMTAYPTSYPVSTNTLIRYIICITWEQVVAVFLIIYWIMADEIFAQLTTHTAIQFRVLCHDLENLVDDNNKINIEYENELIRRLSKIVQRHRDLLMYCKIIQNMFNPIIFLVIMITGASLCFCVFRLEKEMSQGNWDNVLKHLSHFLVLIIQTIVYCAYAETLTEQSRLVARAAYDCPWVERSKRFKMLIFVIIMRSQKEFNCTAYNFFSVNLSQMTRIANTAASYFTLLKTIT